MIKYAVNNIDQTMNENRAKAARYGWLVEYSGNNPMKEPSFFPYIDSDQIMLMAKMAYRRDCNQTCKFGCNPHPLLRIGEHHYCKLCTVAWNAIVTNKRKFKK